MNLIDTTPQELIRELENITELYCKSGELMVKILRLHADYYNAFRADHKSDASLERAFELTADGLALLELKQKMKNLDWKKQAISRALKLKEQELLSIR